MIAATCQKREVWTESGREARKIPLAGLNKRSVYDGENRQINVEILVFPEYSRINPQDLYNFLVLAVVFQLVCPRISVQGKDLSSIQTKLSCWCLCYIWEHLG